MKVGMRTVAWLVLLGGLCGCFAAVRAYREGSTCTPEAAERTGTRDARAGRALDERYASICGVAENSLNRMYRDAYDGVPAAERGKAGFLRRLFGRS